MPRAEANPIGKVWGIRLHGVTPERDAILKDISGIVVVSHNIGKSSQRPHYHIYYESKEIRKDSLKQVLKASDKWSEILTDSKQYTFTTSSDYTIESYWKYVWDKSKGQELKCWNLPGDPLPIIEYDVPIVVLPGSKSPEVIQHVLDKRSSESKMNKFAEYCYNEYQEDEPPRLDEDLIIDYLIDYSKGGFNDNNAGQYIRFALYYICEKEGESLKTRKTYLKSLWKERVKKRFFS